MNEVVTGAVTGTGNDINVELGFVPSYVKVVNRTKLGTDGNLIALEYWDGMGAGNAIGTVEVVEGSANTSHNLANKTSDGVTVITSPFYGFKIPAAFQGSGDELYYIAVR